MRKFISNLLAGVVWAAAAMAAEATNPPIEITADRARLVHARQQLELEGHVRLVRGAMRLECRRLVAVYAQDSGGRLELVRAVAHGEVHFWNEDTEGRGDEAVYDARAETVRLVGHAVLVRATGRVEGREIVYNLRTQQAQASPEEGKKVRVFIEEGGDAGP
ncbi:MAG: hypothetical protein D6771_00540 [Zetaproteobacteria bacterium]|nr:MAG: hypothetical protein D6771_00540 [Zetaproteobacteria bacterium]